MLLGGGSEGWGLQTWSGICGSPRSSPNCSPPSAGQAGSSWSAWLSWTPGPQGDVMPPSYPLLPFPSPKPDFRKHRLPEQWGPPREFSLPRSPEEGAEALTRGCRRPPGYWQSPGPPLLPPSPLLPRLALAGPPPFLTSQVFLVHLHQGSLGFPGFPGASGEKGARVSWGKRGGAAGRAAAVPGVTCVCFVPTRACLGSPGLGESGAPR